MNLDQLIAKSKEMGYGDVHIKIQPEVGLQAFIAIHSTHLGPALGGCRFLEYPTSEDAYIDVLRLGRGMSYKAALAHLNYGGGKAVIMKPNHPVDRSALFTAFGKFVNELGGRYITAIDSGSELADMDIVAKQTSYVAGTLQSNADPSPRTALGVLRTMEAALEFKFGSADFKNRHIIIQGMGHVGQALAELLHVRGAKLTITDKEYAAVAEYAKKLNAQVIEPEKIYAVAGDIFAPCALGNVLNDQTIPLLQVPIVAGSANNQLGEAHHAVQLQNRDILYAPDFVANAGGLIFVTTVYEHKPIEKADEKINEIYDTMLAIFSEAKAQQCSTAEVADKIAEQRLHT